MELIFLPLGVQLELAIYEEKLFVISDGQEVHGVFFFWIGNDPTYNRIDGKWCSDCPYGTIHRIAGDGSGGILKAAVAFGEKQIEHLRIDTHEDNHVMQSAVKKLGFQRSGIIYLEDGSPRIGYDYLTAEKQAMIRQANPKDIPRISEILVFTKRVNYRRIFHNNEYSFGVLQVLSVARELETYPERLKEIWVFDEGFV